ncbi:site-specific DNA-methyltransferase, partial [Mycoplasma zalophidermidis]
RTGWLNMMSERLRMAKNLLKEDGVIFVSIDDTEQAYLKVLMDEIFGEENFVANIIWQNKYTISNDKKNGITIQNEYIIMFSKNEKTLKLLNKPLRDEYIDKTYKNPDNDSRGLYMTVQMFKKKNPKSYEVISPSGIKFNLPWNFSKETFLKLQSDNRIYWGKNNDSIPRKKVFLSESKGSGNVNLIWDGKNNGYTADGSSLIEKILVDKNKFLYPKPITLIIQLLKMFDQDIRVLDFFAGSGTTGHAVMELNREDGGNRTFTLVT